MMSIEEGVSPVIATILMVAIAVVLAASLYVLVSGNLIGSSPYSTAKLVGSLVENPKTSFKKSLNFTITMAEPEVTAPSNVKIVIVHGDILGTLRYNSKDNIWTNATSGGKWHYEAKLKDINGDGRFGDGDKLWVYVVDDNPSDNVHPPDFVTGDKVLFSIIGYHGTSSGGEVQL